MAHIAVPSTRMIGTAVEAWEFDPGCDVGDVMRLAAERVAPPTFRGVVLSTRGDAVTLQIMSGSPSGDPMSLFYLSGHGAFALSRVEAWPPLPGRTEQRLLITFAAYPPARAEASPAPHH
jgi:hypothetical protein